jgi:hypothetical protein
MTANKLNSDVSWLKDGAMIADLTALQEIRSAWNGVEALRERIQVGLFASVGIIGGVYPLSGPFHKYVSQVI